MSNTHDDTYENLPNDLPACTSPSRPLSAKRLRDRTHRKSVSFNDVPIVHEVPSHDIMRNSNSDIYRSWTFTETTSPISVVSPFSSTQILPPFNSSNAAAQKFHANRLSSVLYSSPTNTTTVNRQSDWPIRTKTMRITDEISESNPPLIVIHRPDEDIIKNSSLVENGEERKHFYRTALTPDAEHYRSLPFSYLPLSESTTTYTSMLSTNVIQSNEQIPNGSTRTLRARSANLPITITNPSTRNNDNISITTFRPTIGTSSSTRTVLKPATIAFHGSTSTPTIPSANSSTSKPPIIPPRSHSYATHSRLMSSTNRPLSSANKHPTSSMTLSRARSANISSTRRQINSPVVMLDSQSGGTNSNNLYTTTKRNPNVRPTSNSYYMHHVLLPANIN
jgi:hypothetical protein